MGDLGKINVQYYDPKVPESIRDAMQHSDIVVNCVGKRYETKFLLPFLKNFTTIGHRKMTVNSTWISSFAANKRSFFLPC